MPGVTHSVTLHSSGVKRNASPLGKRGCPPVCEDNPRALASGLSYVDVDKHGQ